MKAMPFPPLPLPALSRAARFLRNPPFGVTPPGSCLFGNERGRASNSLSNVTSALPDMTGLWTVPWRDCLIALKIVSCIVKSLYVSSFACILLLSLWYSITDYLPSSRLV